MPRDLYSCAWDFAALNVGTISASNAAVLSGSVTGNLGFATGVYMHGAVAVTPPPSTLIDGVLISSLEVACTTLISNLSLSFNAANCRYTIARLVGGNFAVTWTGTAGIVMRDLLGFTADLSGATTYTSTKRPKYLIVSRLAGQSEVHETYEPGGRISYAESDSGQAYSTHPVELPTYRDWVQPFETLDGPTNAEWSASNSVGGAAVRRANVASNASVYWTWEDFYKHLRATLPFALVDKSISPQGNGPLYKLRGEGAHFDPTRITADYDGHWSMPLRTRYVGELEAI